MKPLTDLNDAELTRAYDSASLALGRAHDAVGPFVETPRKAACQARWELYQAEMIRRRLDRRAG